MKLALPTLRFIVFSLVAVALCALPAAADDLVYHSGGRTFAVEKSAGEFAVELPPGTYTATRTKLASEPDVTIEPLPWARDRLDHFIVRVSETVAEPVTTIRELLGVGEVSPVYRIEGYDQPVLGSGNVILRLGGGLNAIQREQFFRNFRVDVVRQLDPDNGVYVVRPQGNFEDGDIRTAAAMSGDDRTVYALPDFIVPTEATQILEQVEDEFFDRQWHLNNVGQGQGTPGADINIEGAWEITFGEDVLVGMHDDSCDTQHEDLIGNFIGVSYDPLTGTESPSAAAPLRPNDAHGTAVMGLIAGDANDLGIRGVAPAARFTASRGVGGGLTLSQVASAFTFARQQDVDVHNNSWGSSWPNSLLQPIVDGIRTSFESGRNQRGMVILFSAGNDGRELGRNDGLATLPDVIGVAATSADDLLVSYSNYGVDIDISAPSFEFGLPGMVTADVDDDAGYASFGYNDGSGFDVFGEPDLSDFRYTQNFGGTSASCPVASGVAALVLSRNQELTAEQVRTIMLQTAVKVDPVNGAYHPITERSLFFGYGRLDATAAVEAASESVRNGLTWPEPLSAIEIRGNVITWTLGDTIREIDDDNDPDTDPIELGDRTDRTLVVETTSPFSSVNAFIPEDNEEYVVGEEPVPGIVVVQNDGSTNYTLPDGEAKRYYALFPANLTSRYGFGVTIDTDGNVEGVPGVGDGGPAITFGKPAVSIDVSPLVGESPLAVKFKGNALSNRTVESCSGDFDDGTVTEDSNHTHLYRG